MSHFKRDTRNCIVKTHEDMEKFISSITKRTVCFLKEELEIEVISENYEFHEEEYINLTGLTSIISIGDYNKITVVFNYDDLLLNEIFIRYTKNIKIEESQTELYIDETALDLLNIIVGNVLSEFGKLDVIFNISTPLIINETEYAYNFKDTKAWITTIKTEFGQMNILCNVPSSKDGNTVKLINKEY